MLWNGKQRTDDEDTHMHALVMDSSQADLGVLDLIILGGV